MVTKAEFPVASVPGSGTKAIEFPGGNGCDPAVVFIVIPDCGSRSTQQQASWKGRCVACETERSPPVIWSSAVCLFRHKSG